MKKILKEILLRTFGGWISNKLRKIWSYFKIARNLYIRNSASIYVSTNHPVLAISSDDWGSVLLKSDGVGESAGEIRALAEILSQNVDIQGRPAVLNAYITTTLPDYASIKESDYKKYIFYPTYHDRNDVIKAWLDGFESGVFQLGYHGRDHFNYRAWLMYLRNNNKYFMDGFNEGKVRYRGDGLQMIKQIPQLLYFSREFIDCTTFPSSPVSLSKQSQVIKEGINSFKDMFGFKPIVFIAPGCCFNSITELALSNNQIFYIETYLEHIKAVDNDGNPIVRRIRWGEKLNGGVTALIRNAHYEPAWHKSGGGGWGESNKKSVGANQKVALIEIKRAFRRREPCILSTHAQNYVGRSEQSSLALNGLHVLLKRTVHCWSNVRFVSSEEIGGFISGDKVDDNLKVSLYGENEVKKPNLISSLFWTVQDFVLILMAKKRNVPITIV